MKSNVIMLPPTYDQSLLADYYSMADVFTICSSKENFPTTCLEAQCCGTPVVGFDTGGTKETSVLSVDDFVAYGDVEGLAAKVREKFAGGKQGIADRAGKAFSKETMTRRYLEEYDRDGRKERILLIDVNCKNSSTGKIVYDLYQNLRKDGREAAICYGRGPLVEGDGIYKFGLDWETTIHAGLARVTGYNGYFSPLSTARLIRFIDEYKPDLIHIHELHAYFVNIRPLISYIKQKRIPIVWTFHCEYMYTGKCGHAFDCKGYTDRCGHCPAVRQYPKSLYLDKTRQMLRMKKELLSDWDFPIVTPSGWLAERVKASFLADKRIDVIHNGIDTTIFRPTSPEALRKSLGIGEKTKVVLGVAPNIMSDLKGGRWILELAEKMKDEDAVFVLVGVVNG